MVRHVSAPVKVFDDDLREHVKNMFVTMYEYKGVGLCSCQVWLFLRLAVIDVNRTEDSKLVICNPVITSPEGEQTMREGCLSLKSKQVPVTRANKITVDYQDEFGVRHNIVAEGLLARAILHEVDHMDGLFYVDRVKPVLRRVLIEKHQSKIRRMGINQEKRFHRDMKLARKS